MAICFHNVVFTIHISHFTWHMCWRRGIILLPYSHLSSIFLLHYFSIFSPLYIIVYKYNDYEFTLTVEEVCVYTYICRNLNMASSMVVVVLESFQKKLALFLSFDPHCLYTYYTISFLVLLLLLSLWGPPFFLSFHTRKLDRICNFFPH